MRLYSRPDCHLCDYALELLQETLCDIHLEQVDIEDDPELLQRYGLRVPVLQRIDDGAELGWPFDDDDIVEFTAMAADRQG